MNKKFLSVTLVASLLLCGTTSLFTACSDDDTLYDDEIASVNSSISSLNSQLTSLQSALTQAQSDATAAQKAAAAAQEEAEAAAALAEAAAAEAKAEAIEEAIAQAKALIAASEAATTEQIETLATMISAIDESLNTLTTTVDENAEAIAALQIQLAAVEKYAENTGADLEALEESINKQIAALTNNVYTKDQTWTSDEIKSYIASIISGESKAVYTDEEVDEMLEEIIDQVSEVSESLVTLQWSKLTSLVFIPELYVNGVEGVRYPYAHGRYYLKRARKNSGTSYEGEAFVFGDNANDRIEIVASTAYTYTLTPTCQLSYHYNPSSANLSDVDFSFDVMNVEAITRASAGWTASFEGYTKDAEEKGVVTIDYKISDPTKLADPQTDGELPVLSLKATLDNDTTVNSDYATIVPARRYLSRLAFTKESNYTTYYSCAQGKVELYVNGTNAAIYAPSINWAYNGGPLDLRSVICCHYYQYDYNDSSASGSFGAHKVMTLKELEDWGLTIKFESLDYLVGSNKTNQAAYCNITEDGVFTPAYLPVGSTDESQKTVIEKDSNEGASAIGRTPIILVTAVNSDNRVIVWGYLKIQISAVSVDASSLTVNVGSSTVGFTCDEESEVSTWQEISANIYEKLGMSASDFRNYYTTDNKTYIFKNDAYVESYDYGTIAVKADSADPTTDVIAVTVDADQKANIYATSSKSQTIYLKYEYGSSTVYVGYTVSVAELPTVAYSTKVPSAWLDGKGGALQDGDETKLNVPAPATNGDVTAYVKDLNELFVDQQLQFSVTSGDKTLYDMDQISYTYRFASSGQPKVGSYQLSASTDGTQLLASSTLVATLTTDGTITYADNDIAKYVLNYYGHSNSILAYAKIEINATYGTCARDLGSTYFIADFLRPVDIETGDNAVFEDATANGSKVQMSNLIKITDWRDMPVYNTTYPDGYDDNGVNLFEYYQFSNIAVDLDNATYEAAGLTYKVSQVGISLAITDASGTDLGSSVSISSASDLSNVYITQTNTGNVSSEFVLHIPVTVSYAWGTISTTIDATVKQTIAN